MFMCLAEWIEWTQFCAYASAGQRGVCYPVDVLCCDVYAKYVYV